jgi:cytochrome c oxidase subunit 2
MMSPAALLPGLSLLISTGLSGARFPQTTTEPATAWMRSALVLLERQSPWVVAAFVLVQGLLLVSALRVGRRGTAASGDKPAVAPLGLLWTLAPVLLVALVALPALVTALRPSAPAAPALRVKVIGHQWWWEFQYPDHGFATATDVHVPVGRPVTFVVESADVMHSLWVPAIGPRFDVPPLRRRELSFTPDRTGMFPGQCAELCGASHAHMRLQLFVDSPASFDAWLANQRGARVMPPDSARAGEYWRGQQIFVTHACRGCHTVRGLTDGPVGPDLTHFASRTTIGGGMFERSDSSLAHWILKANQLKQGSSMPGFPVPAKDLRPLILWLQSLR